MIFVIILGHLVPFTFDDVALFSRIIQNESRQKTHIPELLGNEQIG